MPAQSKPSRQSERTGAENKWFALTGRVVALKVETDGDIHIALQDATGDKPGMVVLEVPAKPQWREIRDVVFNWIRTKFPFQIAIGNWQFEIGISWTGS